GTDAGARAAIGRGGDGVRRAGAGTAGAGGRGVPLARRGGAVARAALRRAERRAELRRRPCGGARARVAPQQAGGRGDGIRSRLGGSGDAARAAAVGGGDGPAAGRADHGHRAERGVPDRAGAVEGFRVQGGGAGESRAERPARAHRSLAALRFRPDSVRELSVFCPECGTWNRALAASCSRCSSVLPEVAGPPTEKPAEEITALRKATGMRYRILKRAGGGGMATVFRAEQMPLQREVVVKVLHAHLGPDSAVTEGFRREAETAGRL